MKCAKCGKEFGEGVNCQSCGVDRVTGLGNYSGYNPPVKGSVNETKSLSQPQGGNCGSMVCYKCGEVIPVDSIYCPMCGHKLFLTCPNCGVVYSSQYRFCNKCGVNREKYLQQKKNKEQKKLQQKKDKEKEKEEMLQRIRMVDKLQRERRGKKNK